MFHKPFKVKSNTTVKNSDRKKLRNDIKHQYSAFTDDDLTNLIPNKSDFTGMKICTHSGDYVLVYFDQKTPLFFEVDKKIYPTVYTMWKYSNILPKFTTHTQVMDKLNSGADLMLPGIIAEDWNTKTLGKFAKGDVCCVDLIENKSVIAIGKTAMSSEDMILSGKRGKGVIILHTYLDNLWLAGDKTILPTVKMDDLNLGEEAESPVEVTDETVNSVEVDEVVEETIDETRSETDKMDDLLNKCFLQALKTSGKKAELPLLISTFYKNHMIQACPKGMFLDVKKSSFKKISKFMRQMEQFGIIGIKETSKGVESIVAVDFNHPDIRGYQIEVIEENDEPIEEITQNSKYEFPEIEDLFVIGADMMPFFKTIDKSKGATLTVTEIRRIIKNYVTENQLQSPDSRSFVTMDPILSHCLQTSEAKLKWDELMTKFMIKLKPAYRMTFNGKSAIIKKGKLNPIELCIAQRAANKKVTLIYNLELYGIEPKEFAHSVQIGVAASTSISAAANRKEGQEVLVQGNQIRFVGKLLLDEYKVPRRFIKGLELAPKSGKKK